MGSLNSAAFVLKLQSLNAMPEFGTQRLNFSCIPQFYWILLLIFGIVCD